MKKIFCLALVMCLAVTCTFFTGCSNSAKTQNLTYNKPYVQAGDVRESAEKSTYYKFNKNNTGEYFDYYKSDYSGTRHYKINFIYLIVEDTVICMYDSYTLFDDNTMAGSNPSSSWTSKLTFNKDILLNISGTLYINENYFPNIPNFNK